MQGKVILVTGGAKRVGAAICRRLHAQGARLVVHYRSSLDEAKALYDELTQKRPDSVALVQADLLDTELLPELIEKAANRFGQLDVLINNASSFFRRYFSTARWKIGRIWLAAISGPHCFYPRQQHLI